MPSDLSALWLTLVPCYAGGKHVGGNDATQALYKAGTLAPLLKAAGAV